MRVTSSAEAVLRGTSSWTIDQADCIDWLRALPAACADACVTDPPYGIRYASKRHGAIANDDRPYIWWLREAFRVVRPGGALICFCRWDVQEAFRFAIEIAGFKVQSQVVWDRVIHGAGNTSSTFAPRHDVIWFATRGRFRFRRGRPESVLADRKPHYRAATHPTEKPIGLMRRLVRATCPEEGLVVDPFVGSGSTAEAALAEGCRFIGCELEADYVERAISRCSRIAAASRSGR